MIATIIDNYLSTHKLLPTKQMSQQKCAKAEPEPNNQIAVTTVTELHPVFNDEATLCTAILLQWQMRCLLNVCTGNDREQKREAERRQTQ